MRVVLFGASGFIGRQAHRVLAADERVGAVTGLDVDQFDLVREDLARLSDLLASIGPDAVVNCAGLLAGSGYEMVEVHTAVTAKLIEAVAAVVPNARLVRIGSAAEYGRVARGHAVREDDAAVPVSDYGVSHLAATRLLQLASAAGRVDGATLRVFNPIGAGLHEQNMLGRAVQRLRRAREDGTEQIVMGSLAAYRDFVDVRDVATAVVAAVTTPKLAAGVFNVASGRAVPARLAVRMLAEAAGFTGKIREEQVEPGRSSAVDWMLGDIERAGQLLGWTPVHDLTETIKTVWAAAGSPARAKHIT